MDCLYVQNILRGWFIPDLFLLMLLYLSGTNTVWRFRKELCLDPKGDTDVPGEFQNKGAS